MSDFWWPVIDSVQSVLDGVMFGSIYALIGIGFTLIFGVMHKINLAYAAASIGGAYASLAAFQILDAPALLVFLSARCRLGRHRLRRLYLLLPLHSGAPGRSPR